MVAFTVLLRATISLIITRPDAESATHREVPIPTIACANESCGCRLLVVDDPDLRRRAEGVAGTLGPYEGVGLGVGGTGKLEPLLVRRVEKLQCEHWRVDV